MNAFVLTYNPARWNWDDAARPRRDFVRGTAQGRVVRGRWSTGVRTSVLAPGDTAYLFQQGRAGRGLIAAGTFASDIHQEPHWDPARNTLSNFADVDWRVVLEIGDMLPLEVVQSATRVTDWMHMQGSGVLLDEDDAAVVERVWAEHLVAVGRVP